MSNDQDSKTEEAHDSTWSKVDVNDNNDIGNGNENEDDNDSDPDSTTQTAVYHSSQATAIYDDYTSASVRPITPHNKLGSGSAQAGHRKQASSVISVLDAAANSGGIQESLKAQLVKLLDEEFKQEFMQQNNKIQQLSVELQKSQSESAVLNKKYRNLQTSYNELQSKAARMTDKVAIQEDGESTLESICKALNIDIVENETVEQLAVRIKTSLRVDDESIQDAKKQAQKVIEIEAPITDKQESKTNYSTLFWGIVIGIVVGYFVRDKNVISMAMENVSNK